MTERAAVLRGVIIGWCRDVDLAEAVAEVLAGKSARGAARKWGVSRDKVMRIAGPLAEDGDGFLRWACGEGQEEYAEGAESTQRTQRRRSTRRARRGTEGEAGGGEGEQRSRGESDCVTSAPQTTALLLSARSV